MSRTELESTIVEPAKMVGLTFDPPQLVSRILDDTGEDEGMLPLLQYALKETWALREGNAMTGDSYDRSGGVREAIRRTAERTFEALSAEDQQAARQLFLRLVTPGEGQEDTRARAAMPDEPIQRQIVEQFAGPRTRLLVTGLDRTARPTVEVAHEALIRTWPRLRGWIDANREKLRARASVLQAKIDWEQNGRRDDMLLPAGLPLERARELLADSGDIATSDIKEFVSLSSTREETERQEREEALRSQIRRRTIVMATLALVALVAAWQWFNASTQRHIANDNLHKANENLLLANDNLLLAVETSRDFVTSFGKDLQTVPGIQTQKVLGLLEKAKTPFDRLGSVLQNTPNALPAYADIMNQFGEAYYKAGQMEKAVDSFQRSLSLFGRVAEADGTSLAGKRGMATQIDGIARILQQQGKLADAFDEFTKALSIRQDIVAHNPNDYISHRDLASSYYYLGEVLVPQNKLDEALTSQKSAQRSVERALAIFNDNELQLQLSLVDLSLGEVYNALGRDNDRLLAELEALAIREKLVAIDPNNTEWKRLLSWAYQFVGNAYEDQHNLTDALNNYNRSLTLRQLLVQSDPDNLLAKYDLAWSYHLMGSVLEAQNKLGEALEYYRKTYELRTSVTTAAPTNLRWRKDLALSLVSLGDVTYAQNKNPKEALEQYESAREILEGLTGLDPKNASWQLQLSIAYNRIGRLHKANADLGKSLGAYDKALDIRWRILREGAGAVEAMENVATSEELVGDVLTRQGQAAEAVLHLKSSVGLRKQILERRPDDANQRKAIQNLETQIESFTVRDC
jgi:tetratricopeptide (TPR) repeat protein